MSKYKVILIATAIFALAPANISQAATLPTQNAEFCVAADYSCTLFEYSGLDNYGYGDFLKPDEFGRRHNCTSYAMYMADLSAPYDSRYGGLGNATEWDNTARAIGLKVGTIPHAGDIAQWEGSLGHVAYVEEVHFKLGKVWRIIVSDDNAGRRVTTKKVIYVGPKTNGISYPDAFITFPSVNGGSGTLIPMSLPLAPATTN